MSSLTKNETIFSVTFLVAEFLLATVTMTLAVQYYWKKPLVKQTPTDLVNVDLTVSLWLSISLTCFIHALCLTIGTVPKFIAYILSYCTCVSYYNTYYYVHAAIVVRFMVIRHHFLFCGLVTDEDSAKLLRVISFVLANGIAFFVVAIGEKWNHLDTLLHGNNKVYPTRAIIVMIFSSSSVLVNVVLHGVIYLEKRKSSSILPQPQEPTGPEDKVFGFGLLFVMGIGLVVISTLSGNSEKLPKYRELMAVTVATNILVVVVMANKDIRRLALDKLLALVAALHRYIIRGNNVIVPA